MEDILIKITDYNFLQKEFKNIDFISMKDLLDSYQDKILDIERLEEELADLKQNIEDNYKQLTPKEMGWE